MPVQERQTRQHATARHVSTVKPERRCLPPTGWAVRERRVQIRYTSEGMGGVSRPSGRGPNESLSRAFTTPCGLSWTTVPHSSLSRNEGVPGSNPRVGFL